MKLPSTPGIRPIQQMLPSLHTRNRTSAALIAMTCFGLACALCPASLLAQDPATPNASTPPGAAGAIMARHMGRFSSLPPTQPTSLPSQPAGAQPAGTQLHDSQSPVALPAANALPAPISATPVTPDAVVNRPHRALVSFSDGQLNVRASDSSLNQILRAISRATGLKITGGVADQRVFGNYGPASTASVLATLLDGTGTNILLLEGDAQTPPELILTVRGGGPTPPNPDTPGFDDGIDPADANTAAPRRSPAMQSAQPTQQQAQPLPQPAQQPSQPAAANQPSGPPSMPQPENNVNGSPLNTSPTASTYPTTDSVPTDSLPTPSTTPPTSGIVDAPNPPAPGSTTGTNPNGAATTPEQIYQQLLQMQKQQTPSAPATPVAQPQL